MYNEPQIGLCFALQKRVAMAFKSCAFLTACMAASACSSPERLDYALEPKNISARDKPDRPVGSIQLHMSDEHEPYAVNLGRIRGGYQVYTAGPAFKNEEEKTELKSLWLLSRDKYDGWFAGIKGSYNF